MRYLRFSLFKLYIIKNKDIEFFRKYFIEINIYINIFWANTITDLRNFSGILIKLLLSKLVSLEYLDISVDINLNFILLASISFYAVLPSLLKAVFL